MVEWLPESATVPGGDPVDPRPWRARLPAIVLALAVIAAVTTYLATRHTRHSSVAAPTGAPSTAPAFSQSSQVGVSPTDSDVLFLLGTLDSDIDETHHVISLSAQIENPRDDADVIDGELTVHLAAGIPVSESGAVISADEPKNLEERPPELGSIGGHNLASLWVQIRVDCRSPHVAAGFGTNGLRVAVPIKGVPGGADLVLFPGADPDNFLLTACGRSG